MDINSDRCSRQRHSESHPSQLCSWLKAITYCGPEHLVSSADNKELSPSPWWQQLFRETRVLRQDAPDSFNVSTIYNFWAQDLILRASLLEKLQHSCAFWVRIKSIQLRNIWAAYTDHDPELISSPSTAPCLSITPALIFEPILHPTIWQEKCCNTGQLLRNMPVNQAPCTSSAILEGTSSKLQGSRFLPALGLLPYQM